MPRSIDYRATYEWPAQRVYQVLADIDYLRERLRVLGGDNELVDHEVTADGVRFEVRQGVRAEVMPAIARTVVDGGLTIDRRETWREEEGQYHGGVRAGVSGMPGTITASLWLRDLPSTQGAEVSEFVVEGSVKVGMPFVGGKLEELFVTEVSSLLTDEQRFTAEWLSQHA